MTKIVVDVFDDAGARVARTEQQVIGEHGMAAPQLTINMPPWKYDAVTERMYVFNIGKIVTAKDYMHVLSDRDRVYRELDEATAAVKSGNELHTSLRNEIARLTNALTASKHLSAHLNAAEVANNVLRSQIKDYQTFIGNHKWSERR